MADPSLIQRAIQHIAEDRIQEAMRRGVFDNLPGHGKQLPYLEPMTPEQHLSAWVRDWAARERLSNAERNQRTWQAEAIAKLESLRSSPR